jgi:hypothetical protein
MTNRTGASSDALLDRMAKALRCWRTFPFTADKVEITDAALAEYDRLRAQSSVTTEVADLCDHGAKYDEDCRECNRYYPKPVSPEVAAAPVACGDVCGLAKSTGIICAEGECDIAAKHPRAQPQASGVAPVAECWCGSTTIDPWCPKCAGSQPQASGVAATGEPPKVTEAKAESGPVAWQAKPPHYVHWTMIDAKHVAEYESEGWEVRDLYAAPAAPERAEGQRVTELLSRSVEMLRSYSAAINDKDSDLCARLGRYHYVPSIDMLVGDIEAALGAVVREGETKPATDNVAGAYPAHQCQICGWPLAASWEEGCVPRNCSYRPQEGSSEFTRIRLRRDALAAAQETKPFDTTSPCGDPDVAVMARDAATGEPTMFSRKHTDG